MGRTSDAKQRLTAAMADLVHRRGYGAVGVEDVCKAAGVQKGSFYHFFPSKRDLMIAALGERLEMARDHVLSAAFAHDVPPLQRIERFLAMVADFETMNHKKGGQVLGCPFGNIAAEMSGTEPDLARCADDAFCGMAAFISDALEEARTNGELASDLDVDAAADAIIAYFEGLALMAKTRNDPSLIRRLGPRATLLASQPASGPRRRGPTRRR